MNYKRTPLFEPIAEEQIQAIIKAAFGNQVDILTAKPTNGGLFNTSYYIETDDPCFKSILRVAPAKQDILLGFERTMMSAEPVIYKLMGDANVPVPEVLVMDTSHSLLPRDYILMRFVDAVPMNDPSVPDSVKPALQEELGRYTRRIHQICGERYGWPEGQHSSPGYSIRGHEKWSKVICEYFTDLCHLSRRYNVIDPDRLSQIEQFLNEQSELFDLDTGRGMQPRLVHNDLWEPNLLVRQEADGWHIAAIVDGDRAMFADPEYEFALWESNPDFLKGYSLPLDPSPLAGQRRNWYQMSLALTNAYVFKVEYLDEENRHHTERWIEDLLRKISDFSG